MERRKMFTGLAAGVLWLALVAVSQASRDDLRRLPSDFEGTPAVQAIAVAQEVVPGQVLELEWEGTRYEIKIRTPEGRTEKIHVDAQSGKVLKRKTDRESREEYENEE